MFFRFKCIIIVLSLICGSVAFAVDADKLFNDGNNLLKKGKFEEAYRAYSDASKATPKNDEYASKTMLMRRVIMLRKYAATKPISPKWERVVQTLHAFYHANGLLSEALALDKDAYSKLNSAISTSLLVETYLEMNENKKALKVLNGFSKDKYITQNWIYLSICHARTGEVKKAKKIQAKYITDKIKNPGLLLDVARLEALVGNTDKAYNILTLCFEQTPPSQLPGMKKYVKSSPDFKRISKTPRFSEVMKTVSRIKISSCSKSLSCGFFSKKSGCTKKPKESSEKRSGCGM